jgi:hypothetical protein
VVSAAVGITRYLEVERYMVGLPESAALHLAFTSGLVDRLTPEGASVAEGRLGDKRSTFRLLLERSGVLETTDGRVRLTARFRRDLEYRDLIETKLRFAMLLAEALTTSPEHTLHVGTPRGEEPEYLRLFAYDRTATGDPDDVRATEGWVRFMTVLSRYESPVGVHRYDFGRHRRMLDIGGNSGEFAHVVAATTGIDAVVFDLPGVVDLGRRWNEDRSSSARVTYVAGDAFVDPLPVGCDLVTFKGVLHDWPDREAEVLVQRAWEALEPGGTFLVFERSRLRDEDVVPMRFGTSTIAMWMWIFQGPDRYRAWLHDLGAEDVQVDLFELDLPWMILTARKPGQPKTG